MIDRFLSEKWKYAELYDMIFIVNAHNNSFELELSISGRDSESLENVRLVTAAPEMYRFLVDLLQNEQFLHNPVKIALTAQKILMRINGELRCEHD